MIGCSIAHLAITVQWLVVVYKMAKLDFQRLQDDQIPKKKDGKGSQIHECMYTAASFK